MTNLTNKKHLSLFEKYGIELEYMVVDSQTLDIKPTADLVLGETGEFDHGEISWSNELAKHVIELKTTVPTDDLSGSLRAFQSDIRFINQRLEAVGACLLPTGAHPWMDPNQAELWPHECTEIYTAYDRIFNCKGHGWVNLQSTHLNLPFANDEEFKKLHTAIRLILPLLPAIAASSPILDSKVTGYLDTRLFYYNQNQKNIPQISGRVIPERVYSEADYFEKILTPSFCAIAPYDPEKILQFEWLNSRGAIARFNRMAIEIRILDIQESPRMDIAIIGVIVSLLKKLVAEEWASFSDQIELDEEALANIYQEALLRGGATVITDQKYLKLFGFEDTDKLLIRDFWIDCVNRLEQQDPEVELFLPDFRHILKHGSLAERILKNYEVNPTTGHLKKIYQDLKICLQQGEAYF